MEELESYFKEFIELIDLQRFSLKEPDYTILEKHKAQLTLLGNIGNSSISVFDLSRKEHVFSSGFYESFREERDASSTVIASFLKQIVHPQDSIILIKVWIAALKLCYTLPPGERKNYKIINDYRVKDGKGGYLRIIDQHQVLELNKDGNVWLALSFIDISPDQDKEASVKSSIFNFKTGELVWKPFQKNEVTIENLRVKLSLREKQILSLIKDGFLSKEIAEKLFLSTHTVNTHRQRILEKLNVDNSMEAIKYASGLGLLE